MKVTICDCCRREIDAYQEMIRNVFIPSKTMDEVMTEMAHSRPVELCQDCYCAIGYLAEGGDLKRLIDKAKKRRRRR